MDDPHSSAMKSMRRRRSRLAGVAGCLTAIVISSATPASAEPGKPLAPVTNPWLSASRSADAPVYAPPSPTRGIAPVVPAPPAPPAPPVVTAPNATPKVEQAPAPQVAAPAKPVAAPVPRPVSLPPVAQPQVTQASATAPAMAAAPAPAPQGQPSPAPAPATRRLPPPRSALVTTPYIAPTVAPSATPYRPDGPPTPQPSANQATQVVGLEDVDAPQPNSGFAAAKQNAGLPKGGGSLFKLVGLQESSEEPQKPAELAPNGQAQQPAANQQAADGNTTYGQAPVNNNLQFLRTQDVLLEAGKWQVDWGIWYIHFTDDFPVAVTNGAGDVTGVLPGNVRRRLLFSPFAFRYGLTDRIQLFGFLPVGWSNTQTSVVGTNNAGNIIAQSDDLNSGGLGDLTAGASFHLVEAECDSPDIIGTLAFTAPTGQYNVPLFGIVPNGNLGQGFWALQGNLLCVHRYDPIIVFYGGGYRHLFRREFDGNMFSVGEQIMYQVGVGFSANDRVTLSSTLFGYYITDTYINNIEIPGTNVEPISMRFAATISRRDKILEPFIIIGMTPAAPAAQVGLTITYY